MRTRGRNRKGGGGGGGERGRGDEPPWPSGAAPGIAAWILSASPCGQISNVVPYPHQSNQHPLSIQKFRKSKWRTKGKLTVSRIPVRLTRFKFRPLTMTESIAPSQNPCLFTFGNSVNRPWNFDELLNRSVSPLFVSHNTCWKKNNGAGEGGKRRTPPNQK